MWNEQNRKLWQQAFGDSDSFLNDFFSFGFAEDRCCCLYDGKTLVAAAYWFEMALQEQRLAYIYAVATEQSYRHRGYCHRLMERIHQTLREDGYDMAVLVPATEGLSRLYGQMGYLPFGKLRHIRVAGKGREELTPISAEEYRLARREFLPLGGIEPGNKMLEFWGTQAAYYKGNGFVCCLAGYEAFLPEFLGREDALPGVVASLGLDTAKVRLPGGEENFAMYLPLTDKNLPIPQYFSLALD